MSTLPRSVKILRPQRVDAREQREQAEAAGQQSAVENTDGPRTGKCRWRAADAQPDRHAPIDRFVAGEYDRGHQSRKNVGEHRRGNGNVNGDAGQKDERRHQNHTADADASDHQSGHRPKERDPDQFRYRHAIHPMLRRCICRPGAVQKDLLCGAPKIRPAGALGNLRFSLSGVYFPARIPAGVCPNVASAWHVHQAISLPRRRRGRTSFRAGGATLQCHAAKPIQRHQTARTRTWRADFSARTRPTLSWLDRGGRACSGMVARGAGLLRRHAQGSRADAERPYRSSAGRRDALDVSGACRF